MTRETKIGLFVGMGVIILIGILISDHLALVQKQQAPRFEDAFNDDGSDTLLASNTAEPAVVDDRPLSVPGRTVSARAEAPNRAATASEGGEVWTLRQHIDGGREAIVRETPSDRPRPAASVEPEPGDAFVRVDGQGLTQKQIDEIEHRLTVPAETRQPVNADAGKTFHVVKEGETLSQIARQYYGRTAEYHKIVEANRAAIPDEDRVAPGTRLVIPVTAPKVAGAQPAPAPRPSPSTAPAYTDYKLKQGETLAHVAQKFLGSQGKWKQIHDLNKDRVKDPNRVSPGTMLRVPKK